MKSTVPSGFATTLIDLYIKELRRSYGIEPKTPPKQEPLSIDRYDTIRRRIDFFSRLIIHRRSSRGVFLCWIVWQRI